MTSKVFYLKSKKIDIYWEISLCYKKTPISIMKRKKFVFAVFNVEKKNLLCVNISSHDRRKQAE